MSDRCMDLAVTDGGFSSKEEAREFADRLVSACICGNRMVQDVITDALMALQRSVESRYKNSITIPDGWRLVAIREPKFDEYFISDEPGRVGYQDGHVSFRGRNHIRMIVEREPA